MISAGCEHESDGYDIIAWDDAWWSRTRLLTVQEERSGSNEDNTGKLDNMPEDPAEASLVLGLLVLLLGLLLVLGLLLAVRGVGANAAERRGATGNRSREAGDGGAGRKGRTR